jgi:hypothetical protein
VRTSSFSKVLSGGRQHVVVLEVDDGKGGMARQYIYIKVESGERWKPTHPFDNINCTAIYICLGVGISMAILMVFIISRQNRY